MDIIVTPRLQLRAPTSGDWQILHEHVLSDPAVMHHAFSGHPMSASQSRKFVDGNFDHEASGTKLGVLIERATQQVIGFAGLQHCHALGRSDFELGFVLRRSAWGQGYAREIGLGQLAHGFRALGLKRLLALVSPKNKASNSVLKKIGMEFHSTVQNEHRGDRQVYVAQNSGEAL